MHLTKTSIAVGFIDIVTSPEYRHFGFAYSLVSRAKQLRGLDLFYCVTKTNAASIALARRLKFTPLDMSSVQNPDVDNQLWFRA
jgi:ribosomal protein S18 acetylase RimI-like enzyme